MIDCDRIYIHKYIYIYIRYSIFVFFVLSFFVSLVGLFCNNNKIIMLSKILKRKPDNNSSSNNNNNSKSNNMHSLNNAMANNKIEIKQDIADNSDSSSNNNNNIQNVNKDVNNIQQGIRPIMKNGKKHRHVQNNSRCANKSPCAKKVFMLNSKY